MRHLNGRKLKNLRLDFVKSRFGSEQEVSKLEVAQVQAVNFDKFAHKIYAIAFGAFEVSLWFLFF